MSRWRDYDAYARTYPATFATLFPDIDPGEAIDRFRAEIGDDPDELTYAFLHLHAILTHSIVALAKSRAALCSNDYRQRIDDGHKPDENDDEVQEQLIDILEVWRDHGNDLVLRAAIQGIDE